GGHKSTPSSTRNSLCQADGRDEKTEHENGKRAKTPTRRNNLKEEFRLPLGAKASSFIGNLRPDGSRALTRILCTIQSLSNRSRALIQINCANPRLPHCL